MTTALILAGHGSHISPHTAGVVWGYVDALRQQGIADEITAAFWKEQPEFSHVLSTIIADTVVVVPLFTASGFYTQQIIPTEMGLTGPITQRGNRTIYLTPALGTHPALHAVVLQRVQEAMQAADLSPQQTAVAVLGHGTRRSQTTRNTTQNQTENVRQAGLAAQAVDAYLDDDPDIPSIYNRTTAPNIVAVPYFLAPGSHVTQDVPEALGIVYGESPAQVNGRTVYYTPPVGTDDVILNVIVQLARATGVVFEPNDEPLWSHFPQVGADALIKEIQAQGTITFGQLQLTSASVRPIDSNDVYTVTTPSTLRQHLREGPFRPLASSDDLPRDWIIPVEHVQQIPAIVETVYPGALADWANYQGNFVQPVPLSTLVNRQQGMYRDLSALSDAAIAHFVSGVCGRCIKHPLWHDSIIPSGDLPCLSPCNMFLASAKEALVNER